MCEVCRNWDALVEEGRQLANAREDLMARGVDPSTLDVPEITYSHPVCRDESPQVYGN